MGSNEDIMHDFVRRELKRLYPSVDGWQIRNAPMTGAGAGFIISRRLLGRFEGAHVLVSFDRKVTAQAAKTLKEMAASAPVAGVAASHLILMTPKGAEVSGVSPDIQILPMQSFGYDGKELVWLKRRAQMSEKTAVNTT
ncbi:MAG: hypothetical protein MUC66_07275 [Methanolinea sp.]|jgi:hypothetical protein|nr:hypothetical protein [Methanolinea sp.]